MNREVTSIFRAAERNFFVDCTVGLGGHSREILEHIPGSRVLAVDEDSESIERARENLAGYPGRVVFHHGNFLRLFAEANAPWDEAGGILVDPGLSMAQLKDGRRGFSHSAEGPLDMRKDRRESLTARDAVNTFSELQLADIFHKYGEVARHREVAKKIIEKRLFAPITSTLQLRQLVEDVYRWRPRRGVLHPAARVFMALRIFINRELEGLAEWIGRLPQYLKSGTRLVFFSYHSLEDRIVKTALRSLAALCELRLLRPYPQFPRPDEIRINPASRSARLRAAQLS